MNPKTFSTSNSFISELLTIMYCFLSMYFWCSVPNYYFNNNFIFKVNLFNKICKQFVIIVFRFLWHHHVAEVKSRYEHWGWFHLYKRVRKHIFQNNALIIMKLWIYKHIATVKFMKISILEEKCQDFIFCLCFLLEMCQPQM